ncbi:DUF3427 domain-containing protein [Bifidobacterium pullorum subsp. saeculare]|uniref:DUF3427 domain-containing protein n=1 Tax=Bifidobacterium pullorum subsp. saeculare TaxID=78257 RepID=A0A938WW96_9BIFI|nr:DUF3427 domain-containing protein [Bifidobacterium pullorum]MBM6700060.1 DUF3427 domain-containing protein [Bifidobacterium pullorum subsp. saeculare]
MTTDNTDAPFASTDDFPADFSAIEHLFAKDLSAGLVRADADAPGTYAPRLIANRSGDTMGEALHDELEQSDAFTMSVAFVSPGAVKTLFQDFLDNRELHPRTAVTPSRLITSTKNFFNKPAAFWDLLRLGREADVDVRVWNGGDASPTDGPSDDPQGQPFHPKGYVFTRRMDNGTPYVNVYVGSSNLTSTALSQQREWNLKVSSLEGGDLVGQVQRELDAQVRDSVPLTEEWIKQYEEDFKRYAPPRREILKEREAAEHKPIEPNDMQREALESLAKLRAQGERRAIVISATGTGKTYLSAFDVRACKPRRMLYLVHQQQILKAAMRSYQRVLGCPDDELGLFTGDSKQSGRKYVFATIQTMGKPEVLAQFASDEFDYILVDEAHHVGADTYKRVIDHFQDARFMLGMTATPERTDGVNIFELFGHNVAYEIRLQRALDENMLCPFHYYGVAEYLGSDGGSDQPAQRIEVSGGMDAKQAAQLKYEIGQLATRERVRYIIGKLRQYTPYHEQLTGLVFCSRQDEAVALSRLFNEAFNEQAERNYRTAAVTSGTCPRQEDRERMVEALEAGEYDYLFTVDLFNEGIDIPLVNQIVMLRSTQSSIIFTQQLGRGLRKADHKDSVTVIDFIGNYANNYLIPVALYGSSGDRDIARKNLQRHTIGLSSISFDRIARDRVLKALDSADWSDMKKLTEQYRQLRYQLGRIPMLADIVERDPSLPVTLASKSGDYLSFVRSRERSLDKGRNNDEPSFADLLDPTTDTQTAILKMATELLLPGLRPHELVVLDRLCGFGETHLGDDDGAGWAPAPPASRKELLGLIASRFPDAYLAPSQLDSALGVLDGEYFTAPNRKRFGATPLVETTDDGTVRLTGAFADMLAGNRTFRVFFADTLRTGLAKCRLMFSEAARRDRGFDRGFLYEQKYTLADVMRLLGWGNEMTPQNVGGYFVHRETGTMPIFVKYATSQYEDRFLNPQEMHYYSKNKRTPDSPEFQWLRQGLGTEGWKGSHFIPLFVMRKEEEKEGRYYYVGHVTSFTEPQLTTKPDSDGGKQVNVTTTNLRLTQPLDTELYRHLTGMATA